MAELVILKNILVALALGALIGLEREYARYKKRGHEYAGIRTFPLIALFGFLSAYFGDLYSVWILGIGILLIGLLVVIAYFLMNRRTRHYIGATTEVAGFIMFFIGALCYYDELALAAVITVAMAVILYARSMLHHFAKRMTPQELRDTIKFAVIALVILPFLPNKGYGPLELFNPFITWLMVVFISGISFIGYILMKWIGERGIAVTGLLGGLVSSMAVTTSFAERSTQQKKIFRTLVLGVILANGVMFIRVLIEVFVLNRTLFPHLLIPLLVLFALSGIFSYFLWKKAAKAKGKVQLSSPFTLLPALKFAAFFSIILALAKVALFFFASRGVYLVSFLSGFADVDAITVSLSQLAGESLALETARNGIVIAALTNIAAKGGIAYWFGGKEFGKLVAVLFASLIVAGIGLLFLL